MSGTKRDGSLYLVMLISWNSCKYLLYKVKKILKYTN